MAAGRARIPPFPLSYAPNTVLMTLARRIDSVNNINGHGCMILAELLGCTPDNILSIMTRAEWDRINSNSPTMVLFNDLREQLNPVVTLRRVEELLLQMNLEAVNVLYSTENHQKIQQAYCNYMAINNSIDINTERSICNCSNCLRDNLYATQHYQSFNPSNVQPNVPLGSRDGNPRRMPANAPETTQGHYDRLDVGLEQPVPRLSGHDSTTNESGHLEHQPPLERKNGACGTIPSLFIPPNRADLRGPCTAPPCIPSQEERHIFRRFARQTSECQHDRRFCAKRTVPQDLKREVTESSSQEDSCHVDNGEACCTHGITSSKFPYSGMPGCDQSQHLRCTCSPSTFSDETFLKSSYTQEETDYCECTCPSRSDLQNNNLPRNQVQARNNHIHLLTRSQFQIHVVKERRECNNIDNKHNSVDETKTKSLCDGSRIGGCFNTLIPCQTGPPFSVFVTYSKHSLQHVQEVVELCTKLKGKGIRVRVDFSGDIQQNFRNKHDWLDENLRVAKYVIVCISPTYCKDAAPSCNMEPIPDMKRLDVRYIYDHMRAEYHSNCCRNMRVIPVLFENSGASMKHLPCFMSTTFVYTYPRQLNSIMEFIQNFTP